MYRVGFPLWKAAARMGVPVLVRVHVHQSQIVSKNMLSIDMANTVMKQAGIKHRF